MRPLSLDCLTLTDTAPVEVIRAGAAAGFDFVSLPVQPPPLYPALLVTSENDRECAAALAETGIGVHSLEYFDLASEAAVDSYMPALERGARLGGKAALALHLTNPDHAHAADLLARFAGAAADFGLATLLEPVLMGQTRTLAEGRELIARSGENVGLLFDVWHHARAGGAVADVQAIDPGVIRYIQINDGLVQRAPADMLAESIGERLYPGEGEFPLAELLDACPRDVPIGIECPSLRRAHAGISPRAQSREAIAALRLLLDGG